MLDRLDRLVLAGSAPRAGASAVSTPATSSPELAGAPARSAVPVREPVISSKRGPRFADHTMCLMCGHERIGLEYQGELMSGVKLHTLFKHTPGAAMMLRGQPRCLGSGMRMVFVGGRWVPEVRP